MWWVETGTLLLAPGPWFGCRPPLCRLKPLKLESPIRLLCVSVLCMILKKLLMNLPVLCPPSLIALKSCLVTLVPASVTFCLLLGF